MSPGVAGSRRAPSPQALLLLRFSYLAFCCCTAHPSNERIPLDRLSQAAMASEEDEVAEDYRTALEELSFNNRNEISNLTAIARDYTAHSLKIAEVLQEHILKVRRHFSHRTRRAKVMTLVVPCAPGWSHPVLTFLSRRPPPVRSCPHSMCSTLSSRTSARRIHFTSDGIYSKRSWNPTPWRSLTFGRGWRRC